MTDDRLPLADLLAKAGDGDFLRSVAEAVLQMLMEVDVEGLIGAGRHERTGERLNYRNGFRDRTLDTRLGALQLRIPKLRQGSYFPPFLEPRKTSEKALVAVIQEAWIGGVSTRRVDELVQAMGLTGISKSTVSKLCKDIDERVGAFLDRPLSGEWPYLWLDATYLRQREGGRIVSGRGHNRRGLRCRGAARDRRPAHRPVGGRDLLGRLPQELGEARAQGREARRLRCP
jgi:transposase-like protein